MEITYTELRCKQVINVLSGRVLGNVCDVIMDLRRNCILGFVVPGSKSFFSIFKSGNEIFIPISNICKIGEDVILVEVLETCHKKKNKNVKIFDYSSEEKAKEDKNSEQENKNVI